MVKHKYERLTSLFTKAYPGKKVMEVQKMVKKEWSKAKTDQVVYDNIVRNLKARIQRREERKMMF